MTRWDMLRDVIMSHETRKAIGKAWPLFFFVAFNANKSNKCITSYPELQETLKENPHTIKQWRDCLVEHKVLKVIRGRSSMTMNLLSPYDSLVTCEQDDVTQVKMKSDPETRKLLEKLSSYNNMSLLPVVAELSAKVNDIVKKLE